MLKNTIFLLSFFLISIAKAQSDFTITYTRNCDTLNNYYNDTLIEKPFGQFTCPLIENAMLFKTENQFNEFLEDNGKSAVECLGRNLKIDFNNTMLFVFRTSTWGCSDPNVKLHKLKSKDHIVKLEVVVNGNCAARRITTCFFVLKKDEFSKLIVCED